VNKSPFETAFNYLFWIISGILTIPLLLTIISDISSVHKETGGFEPSAIASFANEVACHTIIIAECGYLTPYIIWGAVWAVSAVLLRNKFEDKKKRLQFMLTYVLVFPLAVVILSIFAFIIAIMSGSFKFLFKI